MFRAVRGPAAFLLAICLVAAAFAVVAPGRAVTAPDTLQALGFEACAPPCWAGITVGQTAFDDVADSFATSITVSQKNIDFASNGAVYWGLGQTGSAARSSTAFSGNLLAWPPSSQVGYLHVNLDLPLWYLLLTLGDPTQVELHEPFPDVSQLEVVLHWTWPEGQAAAIVPIDSVEEWDWDNAATSFSVTARPDSVGFGRSLRAWHVIGHAAWQGFVPIADYGFQSAASS